ncbi:AMP-binding protein [Amycolatopsis sp. NPDC059657]|uniref:AMP-binding protein n=1 Tax=Amycolatopsis sp. NPDC059657 TaxID=3346899 RepID=UPI0036735057
MDTYANDINGLSELLPNGGELIHNLLDEAVAEYPTSSAVRDAKGVWTYTELDEVSKAFSAWLQQHGVKPGDRVMAQLPSERELAAYFIGASRAGAIFVPLHPNMKTYHIKSVLQNSEPVLAITTGAQVGKIAELTSIPVLELGDVFPEVLDLVGKPEQLPEREISPEDVAVLIYTSGSTAAPKAVILPHRQVCFASRSLQADLGYSHDDVVFCRFPLSWDYGLYKVLLAILGRSEIVLAGEESDLVLLKRMREVGATIVPIVPSLATMIATLAQRDHENLPPIRIFSNTGAALPAPTIAALREAFPGVKVVRQFGQTECKRISIMPPSEDGQRLDSVGRPLRGTKVFIMDEDGNKLGVGEVGEIVAEGPHVMPGYWNNPEQTARAFRTDPDGVTRLHTGDYGSMDSDGYLYFEGRRDDMFKRKGVRMSTIEIEAAAMDIPGVRVAAAIPPATGRDLTIFVESELGSHVVLRELAQRLEPAKVPAVCKVVADFPLTLHGKNSRQTLVELLEGTAK